MGVYDDIAEVYHLVYEDWDEAIRRQAAMLDAIVTGELGPGPHAILDVSCGIGTQALGLAALGHHLTASDVSVAAVDRARREADARGLAITFRYGDMRSVAEVHDGRYDVVLSADNSVPHLLSDADILEACSAFFERLRPGGMVVVTVRDYQPDEDRTSPQLWPYGFRTDGEDRWFVVQTRDWEGDVYDVAMVFVREARGGRPAATVVSGRSHYRAVPTDRLVALLGRAGFEDARRLPAEAFFQPVVVAQRPGD